MQSAASALPAFARLRSLDVVGRFELPRGPFVAAASIVMTVFVAAFLYAPAQSYYQAMRENQRLEMEYAALQSRNAAIEAQNDSLSTAAGVETAAHEEFGWVKKGEQTANVPACRPSRSPPVRSPPTKARSNRPTSRCRRLGTRPCSTPFSASRSPFLPTSKEALWL